MSTPSLGLLWCLSSSVSCLTLHLFKPSQFGLWKRFVKSSYFLSSSYIRALGKIRLRKFSFSEAPSAQRIWQRRNKSSVSQKLKDVPKDISTEM
ncbi:hypothetical protein TNCV_3149171 [Trichonephila clavipes]|nr:hypothetical protein TNCV_3149171 [Trichonephila clavipes]